VPVVTINKLDRAFLELQLGGEEMYQKFVKEIENVNVTIATYRDDSMGEIEVGADKGTVSFSAVSTPGPSPFPSLVACTPRNSASMRRR